MRITLAALVMMVLAGCAGSKPQSTTASVQPDDQLICKNERVTGSSRPRRVCRTVAEIEADRTQGRQTLRDLDESSRAGTGDNFGMESIGGVAE